jgi:hypothetical protein
LAASKQGVIIGRDPRFWLALGVAPLVLLLFQWAGVPLSPPDWPLQQPSRFFGLVLLWPVLEELVFRGGLQPALGAGTWGRRSLCGFTAANGITSLIFAGAHLFTHPPLWALAIFFPSLLFGYFRDRHDSLLSPIILHVGYNLGYYWLFGG